MSNVFDILGNVANALAKTGDTKKASGLADLFNENNHKTKRGKSYSKNGRGIFKVISSAYDYFIGKGDKTTASNIAASFVNKKGRHSWDK